MKRILILLVMLFTIIILSWGCTTSGNNLENDSKSFSSTTTFVTRDSNMLFKAKGLEPPIVVDQIDFRSSQIEFWSIETIEDVDKLISAYYEGANSTYVDLFDIDKTFIFKPNELVQFTRENNVAFENKKYNIIRLDIGSGTINFTVNGNLISGPYLNCNSIIFIDREFLTESVYVERINSEYETYISKEEEFKIVDTIILNSDVYNNGTIDVDGALFIPFEATDFSSYETISSVVVDISWNLNNLLSIDGESYFFTDRVSGFPYDFEVILLVE